MKKLFLLASLLMAFGISADAGDITSPNGQIKVNFTWMALCLPIV